jgi:hypothetical protein
MADIYRASRLTLIWLGVETPELKGSFSAIKAARKLFPLDYPAHIDCTMEEFQRGYGCDVSSVTKQLRFEFDWKPIASVLRLPWFRRKWVIQEVAMSEKATLICGRQMLTWNTLEELIMYLNTLEIVFVADMTWDPVIYVVRHNLYCMAQTRCFKEK